MILKNETASFKNFNSTSFITSNQLLNILEDENEFKDDLKRVFKLDKENNEVIKIGNTKQLIQSLKNLDSQCHKIDIISKIKDINLKTLLEDEKAIFEIFSITDPFILSKNKSDLLLAETRYAAKNDLLDYYNLSKFANYCRDNKYNNLIEDIRDYLKSKNTNNKEEKKLRLLYVFEDEAFYLRAVTSEDYRDFGINFSVFVALIALSRYVEDTKNEMFIDNFMINDSNLYISFTLKNQTKLNKELSLSFNLVLENDEVKRNSVSFNGIFKLKYEYNSKTSEIFIKPRGIKKEDVSHPVDLLTFPHRGKVENVFDKTASLPELIQYFINQVSNDAIRISNIKNPDDVRKLISNKVKFAKNQDFKQYKGKVYNKLMSINVDNTFKLFELLREVEELFEHDDVISRNFWRTKLYRVVPK